MRRAGPAPALLLFGALAWGCGNGSGTPEVAAPSALAVEAAPVELQEGYRVRERFAGRVVSRRSSDLGFERAGRLVEVRVDEGERVEKGEVLARLETRPLRAQERQLQSQQRAIRSRLALAELTRERRKTLMERESISVQRYDEARFDADALAAELAAAEAALERVRVDLELSELVAPFSGTVTARHTDEGTVVTPGQPLLRLIEDEALELRVGVPPDTAEGLRRGESYAAEIHGQRHGVRLDRLVPSVEADTRTVTALFLFDEPPSGVRHGDLARLAVETERRAPGFWLPNTALTESRRGLWSAYALVGDDGERRVERRELQLLHSESDRAYLRGTLQDGEWVVASGLHRLVPGQRVRVVR